MPSKILIVQGRPDSSATHFCHRLGAAYKSGAQRGGFEIQETNVATLDFPLIRSQLEFEKGVLPKDIQTAQQQITWADHIVIIYPLWLGTMPVLLKGFFEQTFRYGFAISACNERFPKKLLSGRTARIIVTMGMPAFIYRWFFHAHGLLSLERSILKFAGIKPVSHSLIGLIEPNNEVNDEDKKSAKALGMVESLGLRGA